MNTTLQKIQIAAKKLRREHPKMKWTDAIKKASKQLKSAGKIGKAPKKRAVKKTKTITRSTPRKKVLKVVRKTTVSKTISGTASSMALKQLNSQVSLLRGLEGKKESVKRKYIETKDKRQKIELRNEFRAIQVLMTTIKKNIVALKGRVK